MLPDWYPALVAMHIICMVAFFASSFCLLRLFLLHRQTAAVPEPGRALLAKQHLAMGWSLLYLVAWPSLLLLIAFGAWMTWLQPGLLAVCPDDAVQELLDAGVDVIWANHPHVAKKWEVVGNSNDKVPQKIIFYALGNTISGQRYNPEFKNASNPRENTGDGFLIQVRYERTQSGHAITLVNPVLITTYINTAWNFVIKKLDDSFISQLKTQKRTDWAAYLEERKKIMENIKGTIIWR